MTTSADHADDHADDHDDHHHHHHHRDRLAEVLRVYAAHPLEDGDAVLVLDDAVCVEVEQLASEWDDVLRRNTGHVLRSTASRVVVAIARRHGSLLPSDYQLWRELHDELRDADVDLLPVKALPAA